MSSSDEDDYDTDDSDEATDELVFTACRREPEPALLDCGTYALLISPERDVVRIVLERRHYVELHLNATYRAERVLIVPTESPEFFLGAMGEPNLVQWSHWSWDGRSLNKMAETTFETRPETRRDVTVLPVCAERRSGRFIYQIVFANASKPVLERWRFRPGNALASFVDAQPWFGSRVICLIGCRLVSCEAHGTSAETLIGDVAFEDARRIAAGVRGHVAISPYADRAAFVDLENNFVLVRSASDITVVQLPPELRGANVETWEGNDMVVLRKGASWFTCYA